MSMPRVTSCFYCGAPADIGPDSLIGRIIRPDAEALNAAPELRGKNAVVVYFDTDTDREDFIQLLLQANPGMRTQKL